MTQMSETLRIEKGIKPRVRQKKYDFDNMKVGDTFYYEGARSSAVIQFGWRLIRGKYRTEPENGGWRFWLTKNVKPLLLKKSKRLSIKYNFDEMDTDSSFYYEGSRTIAPTAFAYRASAGRYKIHKEGNGWRFELLRPIKHLLD